jgi:hypothetical protein
VADELESIDEGGTDAGGTDASPANETPTLQAEDGSVGDPDDPQYQHWQQVYATTRQRERQALDELQAQRQQYAEALQQFYTNDDYALQVIAKRFPHLAGQVNRQAGTHALEGHGGQDGEPLGLTEALTQRLGTDLQFLAPSLGPALESAITDAIRRAVAPLQQQAQTQQQAAQAAERARVLADMDANSPGWEAQQQQMAELEAFLASNQLVHPKYGSRYQLLARLASPDAGRVTAARQMAQAGRNRLTTGRAGRPSTPDVGQQILQAKTDSEAFRVAAESALRELRQAG